MKVGDLVKYKQQPTAHYGYGIVLKYEEKVGMYLLYWLDSIEKYNDYVWETQVHLEVISASR